MQLTRYFRAAVGQLGHGQCWELVSGVEARGSGIDHNLDYFNQFMLHSVIELCPDVS